MKCARVDGPKLSAKLAVITASGMHILLNWLTKAVGNEKKKEGLLYFFTEVVTKKKVFEMLETI